MGDKWAGVQITDDYTQTQENVQQDMRVVVVRAKSLNMDARLKGEGMVVEGVLYTEDNFSKIPDRITPAAV